jgi:hypothetical protein
MLAGVIFSDRILRIGVRECGAGAQTNDLRATA